MGLRGDKGAVDAVYLVSNWMANSYIYFLSFFFLLKEKRNKKVQARHDRSAHPCWPAPPHCLRGIVVLVMYCWANNGAGVKL
jgi:hypothetical protein